MSKMSINFGELYGKVSDYLIKNDKPVDVAAQRCKDIVFRGLRQFFYPINMRNGSLHEWSFLKQYWTLNTIASAWQYALPDNFGDILSNPTFDKDSGYPPITKRDAEQILEWRSASWITPSTYLSYPEYYAIVPVTYDNKTGTYYQIWMYPTPSQSWFLSLFYHIDPLKPEKDTDYLPGGIKAIEAILESCLAAAEQQELNMIGIHSQLADKLTQNLIIADDVVTANTLGNMYGPKELWPRSLPSVFDNTIDNWYSSDNPL